MLVPRRCASRPALAVLFAILLSCADALAQQRPLVTEDPEVIGQGRLLVEAGVETAANITYPVSGLVGHRVALPLGVSFGLGPSAELQIDSGANRLSIDRRIRGPLDSRVPADITRTSDVLDVVVATKIKVLSESTHRPAVGVRFATQLPNASNERGVGQDTLNFFASVLFAKTSGSYRVVGNAGVGLLSDVLEGSLQHDAFIGSVSVARAITSAFEVAGEFAGQKVLFADIPPIGAEPRGVFRAAARWTRGGWRVDAGILAGVTEREPDVGVSLGFTWVAQVR